MRQPSASVICRWSGGVAGATDAIPPRRCGGRVQAHARRAAAVSTGCGPISSRTFATQIGQRAHALGEFNRLPGAWATPVVCHPFSRFLPSRGATVRLSNQDPLWRKRN